MYVKPIDYVEEERPKRPRGRPKGTTGKRVAKHRTPKQILKDKQKAIERRESGELKKMKLIYIKKMKHKGAVMGDVNGNKGKFVAKITSKDAAVIEAAVNHMLKQFVHEVSCGLLDVDYTVKAEVARRKDQLSIMRDTISTIRQLKELAVDIREDSGEQATTPEEAVENIVLFDQAKELLQKVANKK